MDELDSGRAEEVVTPVIDPFAGRTPSLTPSRAGSNNRPDLAELALDLSDDSENEEPPSGSQPLRTSSRVRKRLEKQADDMDVDEEEPSEESGDDREDDQGNSMGRGRPTTRGVGGGGRGGSGPGGIATVRGGGVNRGKAPAAKQKATRTVSGSQQAYNKTKGQGQRDSQQVIVGLETALASHVSSYNDYVKKSEKNMKKLLKAVNDGIKRERTLTDRVVSLEQALSHRQQAAEVQEIKPVVMVKRKTKKDPPELQVKKETIRKVIRAAVKELYGCQPAVAGPGFGESLPRLLNKVDGSAGEEAMR